MQLEYAARAIRALSNALLVAAIGSAAVATAGMQRAVAAPSPISARAACTSLDGRTVDQVSLTAALVAANGPTPHYCKVNGRIAPSLNFEIRLPEKWNGKLYYGGGGGYDGAIPTVLAAPLVQGYAEVASDSGHQGDGMSAEFALHDPQAARLFGSEAVPTVLATALNVVKTAYGAAPSRSYFEGCSTGGREALMVLQRHPGLFNGIIARSPAFNWVGLNGAFNGTAKALAAPGGAFSVTKVALLARHVREACDALDGVVDGVVANPNACTAQVLNLASLRCPGGGDTRDSCLSDAQLAVVHAWTTDVTYHGIHTTYYSKGYNLTGNEDGAMNFGVWASGNGDVKKAGQYLVQDTTVKYYFAHDPNADSLQYSPWDRDPKALDAMAALNDATQADIRPFIQHGGKLIVWHGGSDAALSVNTTAAYVQSMQQAVGATSAKASTRFYVAPGADHCVGGAGPDNTDLLAALDSWVTHNDAPGTLVAQKRDSGGAQVRSMPLCPYPQYPRYVGPVGDAAAISLAKNYACTAPPTRHPPG